MKQKRAGIPAHAAVLCALFCSLIVLCFPAAAGTVLLPDRMKRIEDETFYKNRTLDEVVLSESTEYIGHKAFARSSVRYLYLPAALQKIEDDAFDSCSNLTCLVPRGSYAKKWCAAHGITWHYPDYVASIVPGVTSVLLKNGGKQTVSVSLKPVNTKATPVWKSSNEKICTVDQNGVIFGQYPGKATVTVSSPDGSVKVQISVTVEANYRAVLFSESTFGGVIQRNRGDVRLMKDMLKSVKGPDGGEYETASYDDLTANEVYAKITQHLITPSRDGDVSMFFFASHGDYRSTTAQYAGRLWCKNKQTWLELPTLANKLAEIKGKVIVLLESCGPGAAVVALNGDGGAADTGDLPDDANMIISAFASADPGLRVYRPAEAADGNGEAPVTNQTEFLTEKFVILTAAAYLQASYSIGTDTYNLFPWWLVKGVGTDWGSAMPADTECGNGDGKLSLQELYQYVYDHTRYRQTPQVYPKNSNYILFVR